MGAAAAGGRWTRVGLRGRVVGVGAAGNCEVPATPTPWRGGRPLRRSPRPRRRSPCRTRWDVAAVCPHAGTLHSDRQAFVLPRRA